MVTSRQDHGRSTRQYRPIIEPLETRRHFAAGAYAEVVNGEMTFHGTDGVDTFVLLIATNGNVTNAVPSIDGVPQNDLATPVDDVQKINMVGKGGNDNFTVGSAWTKETSLSGGSGTDHISGGSGIDYVNGGGDNDTIYTHGGNDEVLGEDGDDTIFGGAGSDDLAGADGADTIHGEAGSDTLNGGTGGDTLDGGDGDDWFWYLWDGYADTIDGGDGSDTAADGNPDGWPDGTGVKDTVSSIENGLD